MSNPSANAVGAVFHICTESEPFWPSLLPPPSVSHHYFPSGLMQYPPNFTPCFLPCPLSIWSQCSRLKSCQIPPLLKTLQWFPSSLRVNSKILFMAFRDLCDLCSSRPLWLQCSSDLLSDSSPLIYSISAMQAFLLFLEHAKPTSVLGPRSWLFFLPGMLFFQISAWPALLFLSGPCSNVTLSVRTFWYKITTSLLLIISLFCLVFLYVIYYHLT